jgi:uncharacterized membrane-anchored protein YitT (DUF2179 family)
MIKGAATEAWTSTFGTKLVFEVTANGATSRAEALSIDQNKAVTLNGLSGTYTGGSAYVCVYNSGILYASETACP